MTFHVGDLDPDLTGRILDAPLNRGGQPVDLTGRTLDVHLRRPDRTVLTRTATVGADQAGAGRGTWSMAWQAGDLTVAGMWECEVQATANGRPRTFGPVTFRVLPQIA